MTQIEILKLQRAMNAFVESHPKLGHAPLRVDGELGALTKKRLGEIKYDLGYPRNDIDSTVDERFFAIMKDPNHAILKYSRTKAGVTRGKNRRRRRRAAVRRLKLRAFLTPGVTTFDGVPVAKCAVPVLQWCRSRGWTGRLVSGWRSAAYSESLCYRICGSPSCPGKCAGRNTNHTGNSPARFAIDVSFYDNFRAIVAHCPLQPHIHNELPNDRVHFSPSGR
jgi:hypothetical protein